MAITNYLVHFKTNNTFTANKDQLRNDAVAFVGDATIIHTHGTDYYCGSGPVALKSDLSGKTINNATVLTKQNLDDYNTIDKCGYYYGAGSNLVTGKPSGVDNFTLQVLRSGSGVVSQFLISGVDNQVYSRYCNGSGGSWTSWSEFATTSALTSGLAGKANTSHTHTIANITNLQTTLDGKAATSHNHTSANVTALTGYTEGSSTTTLTATMSLNTALASLQNQIQGKAASNHTHTIAQVSGLQAELDSKLESVSLADLGVTATAAELNKLDGCTATVTELNYVDGVTSNIQTQLNGKQASITGGASTITSSNLTASRALVSNTSGKVVVSAVTSTELGYLDGVTSNIQTQLNNKANSSQLSNYLPLSGGTLTGGVTLNCSISSGGSNGLYHYGSGDGYIHLIGSTGVEIYTSGLGVRISGGSGVLTLNRGGFKYDGTNISLEGHTHSATDITSGTLSIARIPTGTTSSTVALGNHTHSNYLTSSSLSGYATQSWVEDQGYLTSVPAQSWSSITGKPSTFTPAAHNQASNTITALTGYTEEATITTLNSRMTLNEALASLQKQVSSKATFSHTHSASNITSGTLAIARIPTGTTSSTVALGNHTHTEYLPLNFSGIPQTITLTNPMDPYGTQSIRLETQNNLLKETFSRDSATLNVTYNVQGEASSIEWAQGDNTIQFNLFNDSSIIVDGNTVLTSGNYSQYITSTDTKNTTGTSNSLSKLYLAGGLSQSSTGVVTYSNKYVYTQSGELYATQMNSSNGFYETSDARLKDFKEDIKALNTVDKIPTKYFTWKNDENQELQIGTSAQEVQKIYPELVSKIEDDTLTVDYAKLSIIALAAIKELKVEIQSLKDEIKQLKSK